MKSLVTVSFVSLVLMSAPVLAGDAAKGESLYGSKGCIGCHGVGGKSNNEAIYPSINGKGAGFVASAIADFKAGKRNNPMMGPMAMTITDAETADIDAYLSGK